ncbi:AAA family ATPase [Butyrivibrio sp. FC2001]|uniref:AAA family ATPase n=1 Tax=Butyrivibrio sp. FC2001 TaxID=1280671 RepID=UPI001FA7FA34|nr:AAA family ATPase [Butyrivibrio sp. FC2001]
MIKRINGKEYEYWQYRESGRQITKRIKGEELEILRKQIEERKRLEAMLKADNSPKLPVAIVDEAVVGHSVLTDSFIRVGDELKEFSAPVRDYKKRDCFSKLKDYLYSPVNDRVFILYGLRRTGKTTMIRQAIYDMDADKLSKTAFIQVNDGDDISSLNKYIRELEKSGYRYLFIDEVTRMDDFIEQAALFSDIYASSGMKIVLSGTDSLGFLFSQDEQLYDRAIMLHTTFISYGEFERVLGIQGIDNYIKYGGTMSLGGVNYNQMPTTFSNVKSTNEYVDSAIAHNIQHSLKNYQYEGHFRGLADLYEKGELTNVINRIVEDMNHSFVLEVIQRAFVSHDLGITRNNLRKDKKAPSDILDDIDTSMVTERLMAKLDIHDVNGKTAIVETTHMNEVKEYLLLLDLIDTIEVVSSSGSDKNKERIVFTQPGLRYSQAEALVSSLLQDDLFRDIGIKDRLRITERLLDEVRGRMMEDIILLETKKAFPDKEVFVLQFPVGEFDMVVFDRGSISCQLYEIKHSDKIVSEQTRHLVDKEKCEYVQKQYGDIVGKCVIYNGVSSCENEIQYINAEYYLNNLNKE